MNTIRVNGHQVEMNEQGLYRLETVHKALVTKEFRQSSHPSILRDMKPIAYLEKNQVKRLSEALVDCGKLAYSIEVRPGGSCYISRELLINYAATFSPSLLISLIGQLVDQKDPYIPETEFMNFFWDEYEALEEQVGGFNHSHNPSMIAINAKQVLHGIVKARHPFLSKSQLIDELKKSQRYLYVDSASIKSKVTGNSAWCLLFKRG